MKKLVSIMLVAAGLGLAGCSQETAPESVGSEVAAVSSVTTVSSTKTEADIYEDDGLLLTLPLKATAATYRGIDYYYLSDMQGSFYISFEDLVDGQNYIGFVSVADDKLLTYVESDFEFSFEEDWNNEKWMVQDLKVSQDMVAELLTNM